MAMPISSLQDVFDAVSLTAYFDKAVYLSAFDGTRYRVQDIWESQEASNLIKDLTLQCDVRDSSGKSVQTQYTLAPSSSVFSSEVIQTAFKAYSKQSVSTSPSSSLVAPSPQKRFMKEWFDAPAGALTNSLFAETEDVEDDEDAEESWGITSNMLPLIFIAKYDLQQSESLADSYAHYLQKQASETYPSLLFLSHCRLTFPKNNRFTDAKGTQLPPSSTPIQLYRGPSVTHVAVTGEFLDNPHQRRLIASETSTEPAENTSATSSANAEVLSSLLALRRTQCAQTLAQEQTQFLEQSVAVLNPLLEPVTKMVIGDMAEQVTDLVLGGTVGEFVHDLQHAIAGPMAHMVVAYVGKGVARNITNMVIPPVSGQLVKLLGTSIPNMISAPLANEIVDFVSPILKQRLIRSLSQTLPNHIYYGLPEIISRSLPILLTSKLTRAITHAVVPSLGRALSVTYHYSYLCHLCRHYGRHCSDCNDLQVSQHQIQYYGAYYSEYYSGYYGDYYRDALYMLDALQATTSEPNTTDPTNHTPEKFDQKALWTAPPQDGKVVYGDLVIKAAKAAASAASGENGWDKTVGGRASAGYGGGSDTERNTEVTIVEEGPGGKEPDHVYRPTGDTAATFAIPDAETDKGLQAGTAGVDLFTNMQDAMKAVEESRAGDGESHYKRWGAQKDFLKDE